MKRRSLAALLLSTSIVLAVPAAADPYLDPDAPDVVLSSAIADKAQELGQDPVRIYEFVRNEFEFQNYYGLLKGPEATLRSGGGNDYDLAALLVSLLRSSGIRARFVRGRIAVPTAQAAAWTGTDENPPPEHPEWDPGDPTAWYLAHAMPESWKPGNADADLVGPRVMSGAVEVLHVWVEAEVPMARYRGSGVAGDERGKAWVPLDPSFKLSRWPADPDLPVATDPALIFDYTGSDGYYSRVQARMPHEIFEDQIRAYLASNHGAGTAARSLDDVLLLGIIQREEPGVLPNALPYALSALLPPRRSAGLVALHENPAAAGWPDLSGTNGAADYRYAMSVHVCIDGTSACETVLSTDTAKLLEASGWTAGWAEKRVLLTFPPNSTSESRLKDVGYGDCNGTDGQPIVTTPTLTVDGTPLAGASLRDVNLCSDVELVFDVDYPFDDMPFGGAVQRDNLGAGGTYLMSVDAHAANATSTQAAASALLAAESTYPIALDGGAAFVDDNPTNGTKDANEKYLAVRFDAQEALTGGLLHLAHSWYWDRSERADARILAAGQHRPHFFPQAGVISAGRTVSYLFDVPFGIQPANLLVDIKAGKFATSQRESGFSGTDALFEHLFALSGHDLSAHEHAVWEELAGVEAISTVKGLQLASEVLAEPVLVVDAAADLGGILTWAKCGSFDCGGIDFRTYCELKRSFAPSYNGVPAWDGDAECTTGYDGETRELRISARSGMNYHGWLGHVFYRDSEDTSGLITHSFTISPDAGGGYALEDYLLDPFAGDTIDDIEALYYDEESVLYLLEELQQTTAGDPVSIFNGNYYSTDVDLVIAGRGGMDLRLVRSYNSRLEYDGPLGHGWTHTFDQHLRIEASEERVVWVSETGAETPWDDPTPGTPGALAAPEWNHDELVRNADGSFTLTTKSGTVYQFLAPVSDLARLDEIRDRNGNAIQCSYDAGTGNLDRVTDTAGRELVFDHDPGTGRLQSITDWSGREWRYVVDADGNLVEYWDPVQQALYDENPATGEPWRYSYYTGATGNPKLDHNLKCWIKPEPGRSGGAVPSLCGPDGDGHSWMHFSYYSNDTVYKHTDALGHATRFSYNYFRRRTDVTQPDGSLETYFYDGYGNVTRFEDGRGIVHEYEYDAPRRELMAERDGFGFESTAVWDDDGNRLSRTDRLEHAERWTYNDFGQPTYWENRRGHGRHFEYDENGNLIREWADVDGARELLKAHTYDDFGNRVETMEYRDPGGPRAPAVTRFEYDADGVGLVAVVDPLGRATRFELDSLGRPIAVSRERTSERGGEEVVEPVVVEMSYDALGRVLRTTDPAGSTVVVEYDANGAVARRISEVANPDPAETDPLEVRVDEVNTYDAMDRVVARTDALGAEVSIDYDARGRPVRTESALGRVTLREYDANGNLVREVDPSGAEWQWEYDAENRSVRAEDPLGRVSTALYDEEGRATRQEGPGGRLIQLTEYDEVGNPTRIEDGEGHVFVQTFDELGRLETRTGPVGESEGGTTTFSYDLAGRLLSKTDAEGHTRQVQYDAMGRVAAATDPLGRTTTLGYDELGNLIRGVDGAGRKLAFEYDARGLMTRRHSLDGSSVDDRFAYDGFGRRTVARNAAASIRYEYDALDRVVGVTDPAAGTSRRSYDADGRMDQFVYPANATYGFADGITVHYQYDERNNVVAIVDPFAGAWRFEYDAAGRPIRRTDPSGFERTTAYVEEGFVDRVEVTSGAGGYDSWAYRNYDALGNPEYIDVTTDGGPTETTQVTYDPLSRVVAVAYPPGEGSEAFGYDRVGNRTSHTTRSGQTLTYEVDAADQLQAIRDGSGALVESFAYDGAGRMLSRSDPGGSALETYGYDSLGRLTSFARSGGGGFALAWDPEGRRRKRSAGAQSDYYFRGGVEFRLGNKRRVIIGGGTDAALAEVVNGQVFGLARDGTGNVVRVTQDSAVAYTRRYTAFGEPRSTGGSLGVERGFSSRPVEGDSGLINMRARHYDPRLGRFLQTDPLGIDSDQLYVYAANNPYVFRDPFGLSPTGIYDDWGTAGGIDPNDVVPVYLEGIGVVEVHRSLLPGLAGGTGQASSQSGFGLGDAAILAGSIFGGFIPGVGEALDAAVLADPNSTAFDRTLAGVSLAANLFVPVLPNFGAATRAARTLGRAGEEAAGIVKNTRRIESLTDTARFRVPDALSDTVLTEVKNVRSLSLTAQIQDFAAFAKQEGLVFELFVRPNTRLSGPLMEAIESGDIVLRTLP